MPNMTPMPVPSVDDARTEATMELMRELMKGEMSAQEKGFVDFSEAVKLLIPSEST